jgi:hypothetical protein
MGMGTDRKPKLWGSAVSDCISGVDSENAFTKTFEAEGRKVVDSLRTPIFQLGGMG